MISRENIQTIIYLEGKLKELKRINLDVNNRNVEMRGELKAQDIMNKELRLTNDRLLKTIECKNAQTFQPLKLK